MENHQWGADLCAAEKKAMAMVIEANRRCRATKAATAADLIPGAAAIQPAANGDPALISGLRRA